MTAFIGDNDAIVAVELSGEHWWYIRQALIAQVEELRVLAHVIQFGTMLPPSLAGLPDYAEWADRLADAVAAIFTACQEAPGSVTDPTTEGTNDA